MTTPLFILLTLLFAFPLRPHLSTASVVDTDGNLVHSGSNYYVLPSSTETGGGLTLARTGTNTASSCPLAVVQSSSKACLGIPVSILPQHTTVISDDSNVSISFITTNATSNCSTESLTWMLVYDDSAKVWTVGIGSNEDYPSNLTMTGWFNIKEYNFGYKFVFCSTFNSLSYEDVGIYNDAEGNNRLALQEAAFAVEFKIADSDLHAYE